ncbi:hypothetical protein HAX54_046835 [Datura stramonium]|uniref:Uncharacterized protein n=1 Tax=Datura stramonium TaxID=4076 RepID=A0ABS8SS75_DATST|nr:hypothetical protein [Datura stramonium]
MAVRNMTAGKDMREAILKEIPGAKVDTMELDLSSLASVKKFASDFKSSGRPLNILINNAGIMATPFMLSKDNIELQFATNHLGHFLLTNLLLEKMKETAHKTKREGRIVNVSSEGYRLSSEGIRFDKINDPESFLCCLLSYVQLQPVHMANQSWPTYCTPMGAQGSLKEDGVEIAMRIKATKSLGGPNQSSPSSLKNVQQGASTTCYLALNPQVKGVSGEYFLDNNLAATTEMGKDMDLAKRLWDFSMDLVKGRGHLGFRIRPPLKKLPMESTAPVSPPLLQVLPPFHRFL